MRALDQPDGLDILERVLSGCAPVHSPDVIDLHPIAEAAVDHEVGHRGSASSVRLLASLQSSARSQMNANRTPTSPSTMAPVHRLILLPSAVTIPVSTVSGVRP
jgi:hypothetical protein